MLHRVLFKVYLKKRSGRSALSLETHKHTHTCKLWSLYSFTYLVCVGPERALALGLTLQKSPMWGEVWERRLSMSLCESLLGWWEIYSLCFLRGFSVYVETHRTKIITCRVLETEFGVACLKIFYSWFWILVWVENQEIRLWEMINQQLTLKGSHGQTDKQYMEWSLSAKCTCTHLRCCLAHSIKHVSTDALWWGQITPCLTQTHPVENPGFVFSCSKKNRGIRREHG